MQSLEGAKPLDGDGATPQQAAAGGCAAGGVYLPDDQEFQESLLAPSEFRGMSASQVSWGGTLSSRPPHPAPPLVPKLRLSLLGIPKATGSGAAAEAKAVVAAAAEAKRSQAVVDVRPFLDLDADGQQQPSPTYSQDFEEEQQGAAVTPSTRQVACAGDDGTPIPVGSRAATAFPLSTAGARGRGSRLWAVLGSWGRARCPGTARVPGRC